VYQKGLYFKEHIQAPNRIFQSDTGGSACDHQENKVKKILLAIRDGWGYRESPQDNAIHDAETPNADRYMKNYPNTLLDASGEAVGLPHGYQGNSEVGHMTIGSGRIIYQSLVRINKSIETGEFFEIPEFREAVKNCISRNTALHIMGLLQTQGVHSHLDHLFALLDLCRIMDFTNVFIHAVTDGRDAPVTESVRHLEALQKKMKDLGLGRIATVSGRFYAMDRDQRWDRTRKAYDCIVRAECEESFEDALEQVKKCHANDETDEFILPRSMNGYTGINKRDSVIFFNFRTDRPRQLTRAIIEEDFTGWDRKPLDVFFVAMTQYYRPMNGEVAFKDQSLDNLLGQVISRQGIRQLRISETEKYAHVTFFFNGQLEEPFSGEDRIMIESPRVQTYDLKPEMSVYEIRDSLIEQINTGRYEFIVTNLVNCDMVGHTGIPEAIVKAVEAVDDALGGIVDAALENGYDILVFADHGNAEDQTPDWRTSHTTNPVPFILISENDGLRNAALKKGKGLRDIASTVLDIMDIKQPAEMTGETIIDH